MQQSSATTASGFGKMAAHKFKSMGSLDALAMGSTEDLAIPDVNEDLAGLSEGGASPHSSQKELKFEEKKVTSSSKTKVNSASNDFIWLLRKHPVGVLSPQLPWASFSP